MENRAIVVMGVSGVGKSTVGILLANAMNIPFFDGDDFHPKENIKKMTDGTPLKDEDRMAWLETLNGLAKRQLQNNSCVIVCSALKQKYRKSLSRDIEIQMEWVHLTGDFHKVYNRMVSRKNHFMPPEMLQSQFDILEPPLDAITIDISLPPEIIVEKVKEQLMGK